MENTGRIVQGLAPLARRLLFGATADASIDAELTPLTQVDRAHLLMLADCGLVDRGRAGMLVRAIDQLRADHFAPLRGRSAPRGLYLLYEDYLIEHVGPETGGILQTARSRNDLNATVLRLRLRAPYARLLRETLRLQAVLMRRARRYGTVVMPIYTHYQAAVPVTYGHYLAGITLAVGRDIAGVLEAGRDLGRCPLGAGAVGGTSLPINPARTAQLLGFERPVQHAIDAVAARDLVLRLLASTAILGITLSRLATDLLLWTTAEFGFLALPDTLVGSSSAMPQKRNVFLLEHVQGRSTAALGAFVAAASAMHATPYTNTIAAGTEAVAHVWGALCHLTDAATLARLIVAGAQPDLHAMLRRAVEGYTTAVAVADRLVVEGGMPFRSAHRAVGALVRAAVAHGGVPLQDAVAPWRTATQPALSCTGLDPAAVAQAAVYGGGPGPASLCACLQEAQAEWARQAQQLRRQAHLWRAAEDALDTAVQQLSLSLEDSNPHP